MESLCQMQFRKLIGIRNHYQIDLEVSKKIDTVLEYTVSILIKLSQFIYQRSKIYQIILVISFWLI